MHISVRGWGRDLGETEIMSGGLQDAKTLGEGERYSLGKVYKTIVSPDDRRRTKIRISTGTEVRLGGTYLMHVELTREEIAQLFFETHTGSIARMLRAFIDEESREDAAHALDQLSAMQERRQKRLASQTAES
jgi:hypothetical protein